MPLTGVSGDALFGLLVDGLGEDAAAGFWRWLNTDFPGWARDGWRRIDAGRQACGE